MNATTMKAIFYSMTCCLVLCAAAESFFEDPAPADVPDDCIPSDNIPGDFDGDDRVSMGDVDMISQSGVLGVLGYRVTAETKHFDMDHDGYVTQLDLFLTILLVAVDNGNGSGGELDGESGSIQFEFCEPGDATGDGFVDVDDLAYVEGCYWMTTFVSTWIFKYTHGDMNGDEEVNYLDFNVLEDNWTAGRENFPGIPAGIPTH